MTTEEFSNEFDTLLDSYKVSSNFGLIDNPASIKLDEYEKSVFLTDAQEELVMDLYKGYNVESSSFENTEESRRYLNDLLKFYETSEKIENLDSQKIDRNKSYFFKYPEDLLYTIFESVDFVINPEDSDCTKIYDIEVIPITHDKYYYLRSNPYKRSNKDRVLRLEIGDNVELISDRDIAKYKMRYLAKPSPIILEDMEISINGESKKSECKINSVLHREILRRAVVKALQSRSMNTSK